MRISVDGGGYLVAATAFSDANHAAALAHDTLVGKLGGFAAIAGDDAGAAEFAAAYDEAATDALAALGDLVDALAAVGRLTDASLANHRRAEESSIIPGAIVYDGSPLPTHDYVTVLAATPPSSLGGDPPTLTDRENWILDHLEAIAWPTADTDRLRDAAHAWRTTAETIDRLTDHCDAAARGLESELSPEIPLALTAIADLRSTITELAGHHAALADSCEAYAGHVDTKRAELHLLLQEILQMVVEGIVVSVAIGLISAGAGTLVGGGAVAARVAAQSPRFAAILASLRTLTTATVYRVNATRTGLHTARARLDKFLRVPVRTDAGQLRGHQRALDELMDFERAGGHTIAKHGGKSDAELLRRLVDEPWLDYSSSFLDTSVAARVVQSVLRQQRRPIREWLGGTKRGLPIEGSLGSRVIGRVADPSGRVTDATKARLYLVRAPQRPEGFRVHTAYPIR